MDDFQQDDSEGNGFSKKTCSETISHYMKFIIATAVRIACVAGEVGKGEGEQRREKNGCLGPRPPFFSRARSPSPFPASPAMQATVRKAFWVKVGLK